MHKRMTVSLGLSALVFGGTMVGCTAGGSQHLAAASDRSVAAADKAAATDIGRAQRALGRRDTAGAVRFAEAAVQLAPRNASYRLVLAQSYLKAGRFVSARQAYSDVLALGPDDRATVGKAALNLALTETATGDWAAARRTLDSHAHDMPVGDLGLALALAGDPAGAVTILTQAVRNPGADANLRQNLALSFALAGNWMAARATASVDMSPADVDARLAQWAAFAQPQSASAQVASLLRVSPVADQGQPVALALSAPVPMGIAVAPVAVADGSAPVADLPVVATPSPVPGIVFGPAQEVVQALPVATIRPAMGATKLSIAVPPRATPVRTAALAAPTRASGDWYVQFGAFENAAVAKDGWARIQRRHAALGDLSPTGTRFTSKAGTFYRLSTGGFGRADANRLCRAVRANGGQCFVRKNAGDTVAKWLAPTAMQVASR